jgi:hypothetical protein
VKGIRQVVEVITRGGLRIDSEEDNSQEKKEGEKEKKAARIIMTRK